MAGEKVLIFLLSQVIFVFSAEEAATFSRSSYFTTRQNKQLKGYVVKRFDSPSLLSCNQQCMRNAWCTSINYKMSSKKDGKGTCELNKHDISLINENTNFQSQQGVSFSMLLKDIRHSKESPAESCPQDWVHHQDSCYYVINTPTPNWNDARTTCVNLGGDLAIIKSEDENDFILELLKKKPKVQPLGAWLGLFRKADNAFYWIDGTPLAGQYSAWAIGQPSDVREKCVHIYAGHVPGKWNDTLCSLSGAYKSQFPVVLCEKRFI